MKQEQLNQSLRKARIEAVRANARKQVTQEIQACFALRKIKTAMQNIDFALKNEAVQVIDRSVN